MKVKFKQIIEIDVPEKATHFSSFGGWFEFHIIKKINDYFYLFTYDVIRHEFILSKSSAEGFKVKKIRKGVVNVF